LAAANVAPASVPSVPASSSPAPGTLSDAGREEQRVREVLDRYSAAYSTLDAIAAKEIWPAVDARALSRAFDGLQSQEVRFDRCDLTVAGSDAKAICHGIASYVPKVGSRTPRSLSHYWVFALKRAASDTWTIAQAEVR
jgi:hypothetical protein